MKELRWFLIRTFVWILAVVGVVEYLLMQALERFVLPIVGKSLFPNYTSRLSLGMDSVAALVLVLLSLLLWGISRLIPAPMNSLLYWITGMLERGTATLFPAAGEGVLQMDGGHRTALVSFLLAASIVILLPFAVAAVVFARIVAKEFAMLEREREATRREYDRQRNLMLSDIAHDLRTPITTVAGYATALSDGIAEPERVQEYLDAIHAKAVRMNELITLLFDYVKLDSEGFSLEKTKFDLCELLRENAALLYADVEDCHMELMADIPEKVIELEADRLQLARVVTNLLVNAMRHNSEGTHIGLFLLEEEECLRVAVADTGACIGEELEKKLFEPFSRGDKSRSSGGSGLGLSIAKKVVEMHGFALFLVQQPQIQRLEGLARYAKAFVIEIPLV
ncbi:MAG: HAMP domain-containing histidine kinase [Blautia sp.]|nr:HAMP domain-containing histidine kinase [Blautia sp.]